MRFSISVSFRTSIIIAVLLAVFFADYPCLGGNVLDTVILNRGNIQTMIVNNGLIGGLNSGYPSGEWPAGSGHDYLKEMWFFVGGIIGNDTVVDIKGSFRPLPDDPTIRVSTDHTTYDYNANDTTGLGIGFPAYGWKVWDPNTIGWANENIVKLDSEITPPHGETVYYYSTYQGGPLSSQETICRYKGDATKVEVTQITRQWDFDPYRKFIFFTLLITNRGNNTIDNVALGLYCDFDIGGAIIYNPSDHGQYDDVYVYDSSLDMVWMKDSDGEDAGWKDTPGVVGTQCLSTPNSIGMTGLKGAVTNVANYYYQCAAIGGFSPCVLMDDDVNYMQSVSVAKSLYPDSTLRLDFALLAARDSSSLKRTAYVVQELFGDNMIAQSPPNPPHVKGGGGAHSAHIYWDSLSEASLDQAKGKKDFKGYKIYRSDDRGLTWGNHIEDDAGNISPDFQPLEILEFTKYGDGSLIPHNFTDTGITNGGEYWYAVVAYDTTGRQNVYQGKDPDSVSYIVKVFPRADPLGYTPPGSSISYTHAGDEEEVGNSISINVVDPDSITGHDYKLFFSDLFDCHRTWGLLDATTDNPVLENQTCFEGLSLTFPVVNGLQITINNPRLPDTVFQSSFGKDGDTTTALDTVVQYDLGTGCDRYFTHDYRIEFTHSLADTANFTDSAYWYPNAFLCWPLTVPFRVWDMTDSSKVICWFDDTKGNILSWNPEFGEEIIISAYKPEDSLPQVLDNFDHIVWIVKFDPSKTLPDSGDIFEIKGSSNLLTQVDTFYFSTRRVDPSLVPQNLGKIHVVPNPYLANASWELQEGTRKIQFVNLPDICTIRIYTLAGDLITTLDHTDGSGAENWNLMSEGRRSIAAGIYIYHVESKYGNFIGKFAVIK